MERTKYVVRISMAVGRTQDKWFGPFIESLRYAGLLDLIKDDGITRVFDLLPPRDIEDTAQWARVNAERMKTFGFNAVKAPRCFSWISPSGPADPDHSMFNKFTPRVRITDFERLADVTPTQLGQFHCPKCVHICNETSPERCVDPARQWTCTGCGRGWTQVPLTTGTLRQAHEFMEENRGKRL